MVDINALIKTVPQLLDPSISIKLVEVAKKYDSPNVRLLALQSAGNHADKMSGRANNKDPRVH
jgi:hypothetical protein